jgi:16S rRNA (guanine(966)-N(2))-methyltransferase RsmD
MRITGGAYKGRKLIVPPGVIRPAMDRMRESLFAVLGDIRDCSFLDLYCGSGSVGIEAASRGADPVVFVEKDRGKRSALQRNLAFVRERTEQHLLPVEHYLRRVNSGFDLIFLDPPFRQPGKLEVLQLISVRPVLAEGGTLIIHLPKEEEKNFPQVIGSLRENAAPANAVQEEVPACAHRQLRLSDRRVYGGSVLLFYR